MPICETDAHSGRHLSIQKEGVLYPSWITAGFPKWPHSPPKTANVQLDLADEPPEVADAEVKTVDAKVADTKLDMADMKLEIADRTLKVAAELGGFQEDVGERRRSRTGSRRMLENVGGG